MDNTLIESKREIPVTAECDVLVAGGGIAGIASAVAAARTGGHLFGASKKIRVILVERECLPGGLATLGLVTVYLPLCDGRGRQVSFGLAEELFHLSVKHGAEGPLPDAWLENKSIGEKASQRFQAQYNPHLFALEAEKLLLDEGVEILYHSQICGAHVENGRISHVIVENKNGRSAIAAKSVVDATGDADVCKLAGEATALFSPKNVLASWYYYTENGNIKLRQFGASDILGEEKTSKAPKPLTDKRFTGLDDISEMLCISHEKMLEDMLVRRKENESYLPSAIPSIPQVRMTRRISGVRTPDESDCEKSFSDSIGIISNWKRSGPVYEIPLTALYGNKIKNLIAAGRCISVADSMWDITRVIPACAVTGEAAGTAAAMSENFPALNVSVLQQELIRKNVVCNRQRINAGDVF